MDLVKFAKEKIEASKSDIAAPAVAVGSGIGGAAAHKGTKMPKRLLTSQLLGRSKPGDVLMSGEYKPAEGKGVNWKRVKKAVGRKGIKQKAKGLALSAKEAVGNYHMRGASVLSGSPFYHGGILGKGKKHGSRPVMHMTTVADKEVLKDFTSSGAHRVALYRPKGVSSKKIHKAISFANKAVKKGMGYDTVGSIVSNVKEMGLPEKVVSKIVAKSKKMPAKAFCTSFPALMYQAAGVDIAPGARAKSVIPKHLMNSKALDPVGWAGKSLSRYEKLKYFTAPRVAKGLKYGGAGYLGYKAAKAAYKAIKGGKK